MDYETFTRCHDDLSGTHFQMEVLTTYHDLVDLFGQPADGCYKTDAEWYIRFNDGHVATIYNWKNGKNYNGPCGRNVKDITEWHIGGKEEFAAARVLKLIDCNEGASQ